MKTLMKLKMRHDTTRPEKGGIVCEMGYFPHHGPDVLYPAVGAHGTQA